ncbi:MAG: chromosome segregation protein SMC, partial [Clostridia bacterium]|nr:chromosome segregation protein SMC [Clostridia bacterium]
SLGRASFLPITSVKGKKLDKLNKTGMNGTIEIASDLVKCDKKYEGIILSLLGRTVIVDDMKEAIELAKKNSYSFKIVTLKGDLINSSGSITGGSYSQKTVNILGRKNKIEELEKDLNEIDTKIKAKVEEKEKIESEAEQFEEELETLGKELQEIHITFATDEQKLIAIEENITKLREKIDKSKEENESIEKQKQENLLKIEEINKDITTNSENMEKLKAEIAEFAKINSDNQKYIDDLNFDVTNLKISVSSFNESESSIDEMVERIGQDIKNNETSIENKQLSIDNITKENEALKIKILELEEEIKALDSKMNTSDNEISKLKNSREEKSKKLDATEENITGKMTVLDGLKEEIIKIGVKRDKTKEEIDGITNRLWEEYELTPNNADGSYEKPENVAVTTKKVNTLRNKIRDLGSVNVDSIEEYKEVSKRYDFMCEQRLDIENTMTKLKDVITEMTGIMKDQFIKQFETINKDFGDVFKELFGGGRASLILEDEKNVLECGIEIVVQPPGKKLQNMTLLSGGERAFTAIALLFAMLKINPSPFCVLDEIEAALDDVNVYRFADYIKKFTKDTQFLVITHRKGTMEARKYSIWYYYGREWNK